MWRTIIFIAVSVTVTALNECVKRRSEARGDDDGHYCVCNATYCDEAPDVIKLRNITEYILITSSKSGLRFHVSRVEYGNIDLNNVSSEKITVNQMNTYQIIFGFGGAITDSASFNIYSLSKKAADKVLRCYFGHNSIGYSFIRTPMGGTDFSWRPYSYDMEENDTSLSHFSLQEEDNIYKIPAIKQALQLSNGKIKLFTTPWSASPWMKTNHEWTNVNGGMLLPEYRQLWANYFVKYFEAYRKEGIEFWAVMTQNEPANYIYLLPRFNAMKWTPEEERNWIIEYLSPTLKEASFGNLKFFIGDDVRTVFPEWSIKSFEDERARNIVTGIAIHGYVDSYISPQVLDKMKAQFPEKLLMYTETCAGVYSNQSVILGSWQRGEFYAINIIESMLHWVSSWVDWNIALDLTGGPNWVKNFVDSPIIVNSTADEFYKQPMFYVLGHFSKYVPPNSVRIDTTSKKIKGIQHIAFFTPDKAVVLVILNLNEEERQILIEDSIKGIMQINVPGKSINTMIY